MTAGKGWVTHVVPSDATGVATTVVVGAPLCGKSSVINALLGPPALAPIGGSAPAGRSRPAGRAAAVTGGATGPAGTGVGSAAPADDIVAGAATSAYLFFRHGESPVAFAYVPGHRGPRPMTLDELRGGDLAAPVRGGSGRPPRRAEVSHPSHLLHRVNLIDTPGMGGFDQAYVEIVVDALARGCRLLFVTEASAAVKPAELDFLAEAERRGGSVTFVLTKIDAYPEWPAVLAANQNLVHDHAPRFAASDWYAVSTLPGHDAGPPAAVEEAALGLAGLGIGALRVALAEPVPREGNGPDPRLAPEPVPPRVAAATTDEGWARVLDHDIRSRGVAIGRQLAIDLATIHVRCVQETSSDNGCGRLPHVFDRELHALSVRTTAAIEETATEIMRRVFREILDGAPDDAALARIRRATRRALVAADGGAPDWDRILLVTATSGVAVTAGRGAVASLAAVRPRPLDQELLPPIGVALSAGCYSMWRGADRAACRAWLHQAIRALEVNLERERAQRFDHLRDALAAVAADTIDHGVLLA
jgi:hypothetical protein